VPGKNEYPPIPVNGIFVDGDNCAAYFLASTPLHNFSVASPTQKKQGNGKKDL
jgi:hypothetical protein